MKKKALVMGVLNVTPDSFSDGGWYLSPEAALQQASLMVEQGADIVDVGGESTRPGADAVSEQEELDRVIPVIERLAQNFSIALSIDTYKPGVAKEALAAGAVLVNDISGGRDPEMARVVAQAEASVILMHMQGTPKEMQMAPSYPKGVVNEVKAMLEQRVKAFEECGVSRAAIWVDPGIGFGKTLEHNLELLRSLDQLEGVGQRLVVGTSRKSFLSLIFDEKLATREEIQKKRLPGTIASNLYAFSRGASVFRVHDVGEMVRALKTWEAIQA